MKLFVADTYDELSRLAADNVVQVMQSAENPLLCPASGDSPAGLYKELSERVFQKQLDVAMWNFVGLDEWAGMNGSDQGSCRYHLNQQLFYPLRVHEQNIGFFDGKAADLNKECNRIEAFIQQQGGIDLAIVGLGMNGHVGMNEPGTPGLLRSHVTAIDPITQQVGQKYFKEQQQLSHGITLGIANLMEARHLILLVSGAHKAGIVKRVMEEEISDALPATLLRRHQSLQVYLDKNAAALINA